MPDNVSGSLEPGTNGGSAPRLTLASFEGPLDLLLHLIRSNEISITDIPIVEICRQYDEYLGLVRELNLEIAGEYLVMAATLAHIKSKMLLPAPPLTPGEEPDDPRAELVRQLMEFQRAKAIAEVLKERDALQADTFGRGHGGEDPLDPFRDESLLEVSLFDLLTAFRKMVEALDDATPLHVHRDEISVAEKIAWVLDCLEKAPSVTFDELIRKIDSRSGMITVFLALLELMRLRLIVARQRRAQEEIIISKAPPDIDGTSALPTDGRSSEPGD